MVWYGMVWYVYRWVCLKTDVIPLSMFLRYILAFGTRVSKTCVPDRAFWRILFSKNLWFIKFTHHDTSARLPGWSGFWLIIQPSEHDSTLRVYETLDPILTVHCRGVFPLALGETSFSQMRLGLKPFFAKKKDWELLQAHMVDKATRIHQEILKDISVM